MNSTVIRKFVFQKMSLRSKNRIWHFFRISLGLANLKFFLFFGAVEKAPIKIRRLSELKMQEKSKEILKELDQMILKIESKRFWPANFQIRFIDGMSGQSFRGLLNLLFTNTSKSYLEIGTWKGSTFCSAINGNAIDATCIDNWSQFGGYAQAAIKNIGKSAGDNNKISILSEDFREVSFEHLLQSEIDVYFYDGPHSEEDHYDATLVISKLNFKNLLFIVDDWNWENVRNGTFRGLDSLDFRIAARIEIFAMTSAVGRRSRWHNGYAFFVVEK